MTPGMSPREIGIITVAWVLLPHVSNLCLPDVTACDQISQSLPPLYLHTANNQRMEVGTAWEQGYRHCIHTKLPHYHTAMIMSQYLSSL